MGCAPVDKPGSVDAHSVDSETTGGVTSTAPQRVPETAAPSGGDTTFPREGMKPKPRRVPAFAALAMLAAVLGPSMPMPEAARRVRPHPEPPRTPDPPPPLPDAPRLESRPLRDVPLYRGPVRPLPPSSPCPDNCGTACPHHGKRNKKLARRAERARKAAR